MIMFSTVIFISVISVLLPKRGLFFALFARPALQYSRKRRRGTLRSVGAPCWYAVEEWYGTRQIFYLCAA